MSVPRYFVYKGVYYDVGTRAKIKVRIAGVMESTFLGYATWDCYRGLSGATPDDYIVEIIEPVYYNPPPQPKPKKANIFFRTGSGSAAHNDDVFHGFLLYLAIMIGAIFFYDCVLIWVSATLVYFSWLKKL